MDLSLIRDDTLDYLLLDDIELGRDPFVSPLTEGANSIIDDCTVSRTYVLIAGFGDGFPARFIERLIALFQTAQAEFPCLKLLMMLRGRRGSLCS